MLVNKWIIWLNDWLSYIALTLRWIEVRWVSEREKASEQTSDFDVWAPKMTTSSMLGRHWTECLLQSLID